MQQPLLGQDRARGYNVQHQPLLSPHHGACSLSQEGVGAGGVGGSASMHGGSTFRRPRPHAPRPPE